MEHWQGQKSRQDEREHGRHQQHNVRENYGSGLRGNYSNADRENYSNADRNIPSTSRGNYQSNRSFSPPTGEPYYHREYESHRVRNRHKSDQNEDDNDLFYSSRVRDIDIPFKSYENPYERERYASQPQHETYTYDRGGVNNRGRSERDKQYTDYSSSSQPSYHRSAHSSRDNYDRQYDTRQDSDHYENSRYRYESDRNSRSQTDRSDQRSPKIERRPREQNWQSKNYSNYYRSQTESSTSDYDSEPSRGTETSQYRTRNADYDNRHRKHSEYHSKTQSETISPRRNTRYPNSSSYRSPISVDSDNDSVRGTTNISPRNVSNRSTPNSEYHSDGQNKQTFKKPKPATLKPQNNQTKFMQPLSGVTILNDSMDISPDKTTDLGCDNILPDQQKINTQNIVGGNEEKNNEQPDVIMFNDSMELSSGNSSIDNEILAGDISLTTVINDLTDTIEKLSKSIVKSTADDTANKNLKKTNEFEEDKLINISQSHISQKKETISEYKSSQAEPQRHAPDVRKESYHVSEENAKWFGKNNTRPKINQEIDVYQTYPNQNVYPIKINEEENKPSDNSIRRIERTHSNDRRQESVRNDQTYKKLHVTSKKNKEKPYIVMGRMVEEHGNESLSCKNDIKDKKDESELLSVKDILRQYNKDQNVLTTVDNKSDQHTGLHISNIEKEKSQLHEKHRKNKHKHRHHKHNKSSKEKHRSNYKERREKQANNSIEHHKADKQKPDSSDQHIKDKQRPGTSEQHMNDRQSIVSSEQHTIDKQSPDTSDQHMNNRQRSGSSEQHTIDKQRPDTSEQHIKDKQRPNTSVQHIKDIQRPNTSEQHINDRQSSGSSKQHTIDKQRSDTSEQHIKDKQRPDTSEQHIKDKQRPDTSEQHIKDKQRPDTSEQHIKDKQRPDSSDQHIKDIQRPDTSEQHMHDRQISGSSEQHTKYKQRPDNREQYKNDKQRDGSSEQHKENKQRSGFSEQFIKDKQRSGSSEPHRKEKPRTHSSNLLIPKHKESNETVNSKSRSNSIDIIKSAQSNEEKDNKGENKHPQTHKSSEKPNETLKSSEKHHSKEREPLMKTIERVTEKYNEMKKVKGNDSLSKDKYENTTKAVDASRKQKYSANRNTKNEELKKKEKVRHRSSEKHGNANTVDFKSRNHSGDKHKSRPKEVKVSKLNEAVSDLKRRETDDKRQKDQHDHKKHSNEHPKHATGSKDKIKATVKSISLADFNFLDQEILPAKIQQKRKSKENDNTMPKHEQVKTENKERNTEVDKLDRFDERKTKENKQKKVTKYNSKHVEKIPQRYSSSDSESEEDPFAKINSILNKPKKKKSNRSLKNWDTGKSFTVPDGHISYSDWSDKSTADNTDDSEDPVIERKRGKTSVKHLKKDNGKLYWKGHLIKHPLIKIQRITKQSILHYKKKIKGAVKFKRIKLMKSSSSSTGESPVTSPKFFVPISRKINPISKSESEQSLFEKTDCVKESTESDNKKIEEDNHKLLKSSQKVKDVKKMNQPSIKPRKETQITSFPKLKSSEFDWIVSETESSETSQVNVNKDKSSKYTVIETNSDIATEKLKNRNTQRHDKNRKLTEIPSSSHHKVENKLDKKTSESKSKQQPPLKQHGIKTKTSSSLGKVSKTKDNSAPSVITKPESSNKPVKKKNTKTIDLIPSKENDNIYEILHSESDMETQPPEILETEHNKLNASDNNEVSEPHDFNDENTSDEEIDVENIDQSSGPEFVSLSKRKIMETKYNVSESDSDINDILNSDVESDVQFGKRSDNTNNHRNDAEFEEDDSEILILDIGKRQKRLDSNVSTKSGGSNCSSYNIESIHELEHSISQSLFENNKLLEKKSETVTPNTKSRIQRTDSNASTRSEASVTRSDNEELKKGKPDKQKYRSEKVVETIPQKVQRTASNASTNSDTSVSKHVDTDCNIKTTGKKIDRKSFEKVKLQRTDSNATTVSESSIVTHENEDTQILAEDATTEEQALEEANSVEINELEIKRELLTADITLDYVVPFPNQETFIYKDGRPLSRSMSMGSDIMPIYLDSAEEEEETIQSDNDDVIDIETQLFSNGLPVNRSVSTTSSDILPITLGDFQNEEKLSGEHKLQSRSDSKSPELLPQSQAVPKSNLNKPDTVEDTDIESLKARNKRTLQKNVVNRRPLFRNRLSLSQRRKMKQSQTAHRTKSPIDFLIESEESGEEGDVEDNDTSAIIHSMSEDEDSDASMDLFQERKSSEKNVSENMPVQLKETYELAVTSKGVDIGKRNQLETAEIDTRKNNAADINEISTKAKDATKDTEKSKHENSVTIKVEDDKSQIKNLETDVKIKSENDKEKVENESEKQKETEEAKVKDEPSWLKFGYTQEPDTIFLSDNDDDMIMSFSQPVINLDTSSDDNADSDKGETNKKDDSPDITVKPAIKTEDEPTTKVSEILEFDNFSSPDEGSDRGSDFEPEQILRSGNINLSRLDSDYDKSDDQYNSDEDIFLTQVTPAAVEIKKRNSQDEDLQVFFLSDDEAVLSVNEENLLKSRNQGKVVIPKPTVKSNKDDTDTKSTISNIDVNDFSSDDEILLTSAFDKNIVKRKFYGSNAQQKQDFEKGKSDLIPDNNDGEKYDCETQIYAKTSINKSEKSNDKLNVSIPYKEMTPLKPNQNIYMQDTQVDPDFEHSSDKEISVYDFHSEHFSDISDSEASKFSDERKAIINKPNASTSANYDTFSEDEDVMVIDDPKDIYEAQTQITSFLKKTGKEKTMSDKLNDKTGVILEDVYQAQTQVDQLNDKDNQFSEISQDSEGDIDDGLFVDPQYKVYFSQNKSKLQSVRANKRRKRSTNGENDYLAETQIDQSDIQNEVSNDDKTDHMEEKEQDIPNGGDDIDDPYFAMTQVDNADKQNDENDGDDTFFAMTQIDKENSDNEQFNDHRFFEMTQVDTEAETSLSKTKEPKQHKKFSTLPDKSKTTIQPYEMETQVVPSDADISLLTDYEQNYDAQTQIDPQDSADFDNDDNDAYFAATQCDIEFLDVGESDKTGEKLELSEAKKITKRKETDENDFEAVQQQGGILKRQNVEKNERKRVNFVVPGSGSKEILINIPSKKPRLDVPARKAMFTEPQKQKTTAEKRASVLSIDRSPNMKTQPIGTKSSNADSTELKSPTVHVHPVGMPKLVIQAKRDEELVISDATKSDMWLSKTTAKSSDVGKGKSGKRKRRQSKEDTGGAFKARMQEAKSKLAERNMLSVINPDAIADPAAKRLKPSVNADDQDDVDLPTCSQIISKGLPILNPTNVLVKGKKHTTQQGSRFQSRAASLTETIVGNQVRTASVTMTTSTVSMATPTSTSGAKSQGQIMTSTSPVQVSSVNTNAPKPSAKIFKQTEKKSHQMKPSSWVTKQPSKSDSSSILRPSSANKPISTSTASTKSQSSAASSVTKSTTSTTRVSSFKQTVASKPPTSVTRQSPSPKSSFAVSSTQIKTTPIPSTSSSTRPRLSPVYPSTSTSVGKATAPRMSPNVAGQYSNFSSRPPGNLLPSHNPLQKIPLTSTLPADKPPVDLVNRKRDLKLDMMLRVMLKWSPNWFEEKERLERNGRHAEPPPVTNDLCGLDNHIIYPLCERYNSFDEYCDKFMLPLLLHETFESCYSSWREKKARGELEKQKLLFLGQKPPADKLIEYNLLGLISERDRFSWKCVSEGDLVQLNVYGELRQGDKADQIWYRVMGFVEKVTFRDTNVKRICEHNAELGKMKKHDSISVKIQLKTRWRSFFPSEKQLVEIQPVSTIISTIRQFHGLAYLPKSFLCRDLLYPTNNPTYCDQAAAIISGLRDNFNESQSIAINTAAKIVSQPKTLPRICLLQGPPGTGKSHTIVGIIEKIVRDTQGKCCICLCAPSHAAVDELLRRLIRINRNRDKGNQIRLVRLGKKSVIHADIQSISIDSLIQKNVLQSHKAEMLRQLPTSLQGERRTLETKIAAARKFIDNTTDSLQVQKKKLDLKKLEKQKQNLDSKCEVNLNNLQIKPEQQMKIRNELLGSANVIAGTLSSIGSQHLKSCFQSNIRDKPSGFDCVIIDEATQAIELDTLIPLQYGVSKLILVGDPEQLPPTVLSKVAQENKLNMSLFERLDSHFRNSDINPVILLDTQYRMDKEIASFPNNYIYEGRIKNHKTVLDRSKCPLVPYLLYDIREGKEQFSQSSRSMSNPSEARFTAELCKLIVTETQVTEKVIGIIAPYAKQKSLIIQQLRQRQLENIDVSTVDGFQGREKHVIIMSCVRANVSGSVGFVGNRNRMNVSLTRAKYAMYLVGHFASLECSDEWKPLVTDAKQRRKFITVDDRATEKAIKMCLKNI